MGKRNKLERAAHAAGPEYGLSRKHVVPAMIVLLVAICACAFVGNQRGDAPVSPPRDKNMAPRAGASAEAAAQPVDHLGSDHLGSAEPERRRDNHTSCSAWAAAGECSSNPTFMLSQCAESCALRDLARAHDEDANCAAWAEAGECSSNPAYMHSHCSRSCGDATPQSADALLDTWHTPAECTQWAGSGEWCVRCSRTLLIRVSLRLSLSLCLCASAPLHPAPAPVCSPRGCRIESRLRSEKNRRFMEESCARSCGKVTEARQAYSARCPRPAGSKPALAPDR